MSIDEIELKTRNLLFMQATIAEILKQTSVKQAKLSSAQSSPNSQHLIAHPSHLPQRKLPSVPQALPANDNVGGPMIENSLGSCRINVGRIEMQTLAQQIVSQQERCANEHEMENLTAYSA